MLFPPLRCSAWFSVAAYLWVFRLSVLSSVTGKHTGSLGLKTGDWLCHWRISYSFAFRNSWVSCAVCFGSSSICTVKHHLNFFAAFDWIQAEKIAQHASGFILSAVTSLATLVAVSRRTCPCINTDSAIFDRWCVIFKTKSYFSLSLYFSFPNL